MRDLGLAGMDLEATEADTLVQRVERVSVIGELLTACDCGSAQAWSPGAETLLQALLVLTCSQEHSSADLRARAIALLGMTGIAHMHSSGGLKPTPRVRDHFTVKRASASS